MESSLLRADAAQECSHGGMVVVDGELEGSYARSAKGSAWVVRTAPQAHTAIRIVIVMIIVVIIIIINAIIVNIIIVVIIIVIYYHYNRRRRRRRQ